MKTIRSLTNTQRPDLNTVSQSRSRSLVKHVCIYFVRVLCGNAVVYDPTRSDVTRELSVAAAGSRSVTVSDLFAPRRRELINDRDPTRRSWVLFGTSHAKRERSRVRNTRRAPTCRRPDSPKVLNGGGGRVCSVNAIYCVWKRPVLRGQKAVVLIESSKSRGGRNRTKGPCNQTFLDLCLFRTDLCRRRLERVDSRSAGRKKNRPRDLFLLIRYVSGECIIRIKKKKKP